jgi:hypothetical protein
MKVDYSTFEEDESLWGKVTVIDGGKEQNVSVELMPNEYIEVTDATKRSLEYFIDNYEKYKAAALKAAVYYYDRCRSEWGKSVLPEEITDVNRIAEMITLSSVCVHDVERFGEHSVVLYYRCTWDKEEGMGIEMKDFDVCRGGFAS